MLAVAVFLVIRFDFVLKPGPQLISFSSPTRFDLNGNDDVWVGFLSTLSVIIVVIKIKETC